MTYVCDKQREWITESPYKEGVNYHRSQLFFILEISTLVIILLAAFLSSLSVIVAILRVPALRHNLNNILVLNILAMDVNVTIWSIPFSLADLLVPGYLTCFPRLCKVIISNFLFFHIFGGPINRAIYENVGPPFVTS